MVDANPAHNSLRLHVAVEPGEEPPEPQGPFYLWLHVWKRKVAYVYAKLQANDKSYYLFSRENWFRVLVCDVVRNTWFDRFILFIILSNCVVLALSNPGCIDFCNQGVLPEPVQIGLDYAFTAIYTVELLLKTIAHCFFFGPHAYLHDGWNWLDLIVVVTSFISYLPATSNGTFQGFRAARALRPLRVMNYLPGLKKLVKTLLDSVPLLLDVLFLLTWLFFVFGIVALQLFMGALQGRCQQWDNGSWLVPDELENKPCALVSTGLFHCEVTDWNATLYCNRTGSNPNFDYTSFDNFAWACLNILQMLTLDNWTGDLLYPLMDSSLPAVAVIYFVFLAFFGAYFAMQLLIAILSSKFAQVEYETARVKALSRTRTKPNDMGGSSMERSPPQTGFFSKASFRVRELGIWLKTEFLTPLTREQLPPWRQRIWDVVDPDSHSFATQCLNNFIIGCIVLNTLTMAVTYYDMPQALSDALDIINFVLTMVFTMELIFKHTGMGYVNYWRRPSNVLDGFVVIVSWIEIIIAGGFIAKSKSGLSALRTFRVLRVLRSLRLLHHVKALRKLVKMIFMGMVALKDFMVLSALFVFIFMLVGMQQFGGANAFTVTVSPDTYRANFNTIWEAGYTVFQLLTATNWVSIMWMGMLARGIAACIYFIAWIVLGNFILLTLFLAIIITNFQADGGETAGDEQSSAAANEDAGNASRNHALSGVAYSTAVNDAQEEHRGTNALRHRINERVSQRPDPVAVQRMKTWLVTMGVDYGIDTLELIDITRQLDEQYETNPTGVLEDLNPAHHKGGGLAKVSQPLPRGPSHKLGRVSISVVHGDIPTAHPDAEHKDGSNWLDRILKRPAGGVVASNESRAALLGSYSRGASVVGSQDPAFWFTRRWLDDTDQEAFSPRTHSFDGSTKDAMDAGTSRAMFMAGSCQQRLLERQFGLAITRLRSEASSVQLSGSHGFEAMGPLTETNSLSPLIQVPIDPIRHSRSSRHSIRRCYSFSGSMNTNAPAIMGMLAYLNRNEATPASKLLSVASSAGPGSFELGVSLRNLNLNSKRINGSVPFQSANSLSRSVTAQGSRFSRHFPDSFSELARVTTKASVFASPLSRENSNGRRRVSCDMIVFSANSHDRVESKQCLDLSQAYKSVNGDVFESRNGDTSGPSFKAVNKTSTQQTRPGPVAEGRIRESNNSFHLLALPTNQVPLQEKYIACTHSQTVSSMDPCDAGFFSAHNATTQLSICLENFEEAMRHTNQPPHLSKLPSSQQMPRHARFSRSLLKLRSSFQKLHSMKQGNRLHNEELGINPGPVAEASSTDDYYSTLDNRRPLYAIEVGMINVGVGDGTSPGSACDQPVASSPFYENGVDVHPIDGVNHLESVSQSRSHSSFESRSIELNPVGDDEYVFMDYTSMCIFTPTNKLRERLFLWVTSPWFEWFILALIFASSITLALDNPRLSPNGTMYKVLYILDTIFTIAFFVEMCMKWVVKGLVMHPGAYWRNPWDILDGLISILCFISLFISSNLSIIRTLRLTRTLRPLRMIHRLKGMQLVVETFIRSLPQVSHVIAFGLFLYVIFGILGMELFSGKFGSCTDATIPTKNECQGNFTCSLKDGDRCDKDGGEEQRLWQQPFYSFNNIGKAMQTLFVAATLDGYPPIMSAVIDAVGVDKAPQEKHAPWMGLYIIVFLMFGSFFWVNMLVSVIVDHYTKIVSDVGGGLASRHAKEWMKVFQFTGKKVNPWKEIPMPESIWRQWAYRVASSPRFDQVIMVVIAANVIAMSLDHYEPSPGFEDSLIYLNTIFIVVFVLECLIKLVAMGLKLYIKDHWNKMDLLIILASIPDVVGSYTGIGGKSSIVTVIRIFRIGRMFKLVKNAKGLRTLFNTLISSLPAIFNVGSLMFLLMFIYAVLGMNLFGGWGSNVNDFYANFHNFGTSLLTMFRIFTVDGWDYIMAQASDCNKYMFDCKEGITSLVAAAFFISFIIIGVYVMMNLVIAVILDNFIESAQTEGLLKSNNFVDLLKMVIVLKVFVKMLRLKIQTTRSKEDKHNMKAAKRLLTAIRRSSPILTGGSADLDQDRHMTMNRKTMMRQTKDSKAD